jgi:UDP-glucose 4-epimerase
MKIMVTGGAGFIGSHCVDAFLNAGHEVVIVDNFFTGHRSNLNPKAKFYECDIRSKDVAEIFAKEKPDVVDHFAAQMNVTLSLREPILDADINIIGIINLLQNCVDHGVKRFLFASTGGAIYGPEAPLPVSEDYNPKPLSHYGTSKLAGEHYIRLYSALYGIKYVVLRYANVYGPRQTPHGEAGVCAILGSLMLAGKQPILYGHGKPLRDYVYVGDIARANLMALEKGEGNAINLGTARGTSVTEIYELIKEFTGYKGDANLQPLRPGEVEQVYCANGLAAKVLGWKPEMPLRDGIKATIDYIKTHT